MTLKDGQIAYYLAENSHKNDWAKTNAAQDFKVLSLKDGQVAYQLAYHLDHNGWGKTKTPKDPKVRNLANGEVHKILNLQFNYSD